MTIDGLSMHYLALELHEQLLDSRIDKIMQLDKQVFVFYFRSKSKQHKLFIDVSAKNSALFLTDDNFQAPLKAPAFSMFLRKYLLNGRVKKVTCPNFERYLLFDLEVSNNFKDLVNYQLIIELMGRYTNLILVDDNNIIKDCVLHIDSSINSFRELMPLRPYKDAPSQSAKANLSSFNTQTELAEYLFPSYRAETFLQSIATETQESGKLNSGKELKIQDYLIAKFKGLSPLLAKELLSAANLPNLKISTLKVAEQEALLTQIYKLVSKLQRQEISATLVLSNGVGTQLSPLPLQQTFPPEKSVRSFPTLSAAMAFGYQQAFSNSSLKQKRQLLIKRIEKNIAKYVDKLAQYNKELALAQDLLLDKLKAELLLINKNVVEAQVQERQYRQTANRDDKFELELENPYVYALPEEYFQELQRLCPQESAQLTYWEQLAENTVTVSLSKEKSISANANLYFKQYNKKKQRLLIVGEFVKELRQDLEFMHNCLIDVANAETENDLAYIIETLDKLSDIYKYQANLELKATKTETTVQLDKAAPGKPAGSARAQLAKKLLKAQTYRKLAAKKQSAKATGSSLQNQDNYYKFLSSDGLNILVGKNALQNDYLSTKLARKDDIWLHLQKAPGCHVIIQLPPNNKTLPERTLMEAAGICAWFSRPLEQRQHNSALLDTTFKVDYCEAAKVKKQAHAKAGLVYYNNYQTIVVKPLSPENLKLRQLN